MDNIVKLPSQQSLFNSNNRLVDLVIPGNSGVYNLSESYVAIDMSIAGLLPNDGTEAAQGQLANVTAAALPITSAIADVRLGINHQSTGGSIYDQTAVPVETLVRNASMFSATRGKVEDIRRVDALRSTMKCYTQDIEDVVDASLTGMPPMAKTNPWSSGRFAQLVGVGTTESEFKTRELRIMLKDLFNIGSAEAWDTSLYGDTHIHLELNLNRIQLQQNLKGTITTDPWNRYYHNNQVVANPPGGITTPVNIKYKEALQVPFPVAAAPANPRTADTMTMQAPYDSLEDSPFWVNQLLMVKTTYSGGDGAGGTGGGGVIYPAQNDERWAVIKEITWDKTTKLITLGFGAGSHIFSIAGEITTNPFLIDRQVCGISMTEATMAANPTFDSIELTAVRRPEMDKGPDQIQYTQFLTTTDQWASSNTLNRSYFLPPQTTNAYMVFPSTEGTNFSDILGCARIGSYRFTINGESVTNRVVPFLETPLLNPALIDTKCEHGSSLHYTLISEAMMNSGRRFHSLEESVYSLDIPLSIDRLVGNGSDANNPLGVVGWRTLEEAPKKLCYMLALPIPISNEQTQLSIELEGQFGGSGQMMLYSEIRSVI